MTNQAPRIRQSATSGCCVRDSFGTVALSALSTIPVLPDYAKKLSECARSATLFIQDSRSMPKGAGIAGKVRARVSSRFIVLPSQRMTDTPIADKNRTTHERADH